jgi:hypothetical protein
MIFGLWLIIACFCRILLSEAGVAFAGVYRTYITLSLVINSKNVTYLMYIG